MLLMRQLATSISDLKTCGISFWYGGIAARLGSSPVRVSLPGGSHATVRPKESDFSTLRQVFRDREYGIDNAEMRKRIRRRYDEIVAAGQVPVIVDAGANIGAATIWFKQLFPKAAVVAVEPDPDNARMLRQNVGALAATIVLEAAIGSEPGFVSVIAAEKSWGVHTERSSTGCPVVTVPQAVAEVPNGRLFMVKIDIEGFESDLFASRTEWIDDAFVVYIEPHDWKLPDQGTSRTFQAEFGKRDFDILLQGENLIYVRRSG